MTKQAFESKIMEEVNSLERYLGLYFNPREEGFAHQKNQIKTELENKIKSLEGLISRIIDKSLKSRCLTVIKRAKQNL